MDWNLPTETTDYIQVLSNLKDRDIDATTLCITTPVNPATGTIRLVRTPNVLLEEWNSTAWVPRIMSVQGGGTGATNLDGFKASLGLGTMAYQNYNAVNITGGTAAFTGSVTATGRIIAFGGSGTSYDTAPFEVQKATPRISFHWPAVVAAQLGIDSAGTIRTYDSLGTGYAAFACGVFTSTGQVNAASLSISGVAAIGGTLTCAAINSSANISCVAITASATGTFAGYVVCKNLYVDGPTAGVTPSIFLRANNAVLYFTIEAPTGELLTLRSSSSTLYHFNSGAFHPGTNNTGQVGHPSAIWSKMHAGYYSAIAPGGGLIFNDNAGYGLIWEGASTLAIKGFTLLSVTGAISSTAYGDFIQHISCRSIYAAATVAAGMAFITFRDYTGSPIFYTIETDTPDTLTLRSVNGYKYLFSTSYFYPAAAYNCGHPSKPWAAVYASNGVIQPSDANLKRLSPNPLGLDFINKVETYSFTWLEKFEGLYDIHYGVTAQQLEALGFEAVDLPRDGEGHYGLNYSELIAPIIKAIQELSAQVEELKNEARVKD